MWPYWCELAQYENPRIYKAKQNIILLYCFGHASGIFVHDIVLSLIVEKKLRWRQGRWNSKLCENSNFIVNNFIIDFRRKQFVWFRIVVFDKYVRSCYKNELHIFSSNQIVFFTLNKHSSHVFHDISYIEKGLSIRKVS